MSVPETLTILEWVIAQSVFNLTKFYVTQLLIRVGCMALEMGQTEKTGVASGSEQYNCTASTLCLTDTLSASLGGFMVRTVLIAGRETMWRTGLGATLRGSFHGLAVSETSIAEHVIQSLLSDNPPDLVTIDSSLPGFTRTSDISALRLRFPRVKIAVISDYFERQTVLKLLDIGVNGVIPQDLPFDELLIAFRTLISEHVYIPSSIMDAGQGAAATDGSDDGEAQPALTPRQKEVLSFLATGQTNKEIARALRISEHTVKVHLAAAFRQLGVNNRVRAINILQSRSAQNDEELDMIRKATNAKYAPNMHLRIYQ